MKYFVTAIGTDSGKSLVSSILCEALGFDYWKPVQCGTDTDINFVSSLLDNSTIFFQETYMFSAPESPHAASRKEGVEVNLNQFVLPNSENLIIEGAGGLMVPLNDTDLIIDLIKKLNVPVILVSNIYLGSINHTLLSYELLKSYKIPVLGIVFNGEENKETERIIEKITGLPVLMRVPHFSAVNKKQVKIFSKSIKQELHDKLGIS